MKKEAQGGEERRRLGCLYGCLPTLLLLYVMACVVSKGIYFSFVTEETYRSGTAAVAGVDLNPWTSGGSSSSERPWLLPFLRFVERGAPDHLILYASDPDCSALRLRVHAATLRYENGAREVLRLIEEHGDQPGDWHRFRPNASSWLVPLHHDRPLPLHGELWLELDVEVDDPSGFERQRVEIHLRPTVRQHSGLGFST